MSQRVCRFCGKEFEIRHCEGALALFVWIGGCYSCYENTDAVRDDEARIP